MQLNYTIRPRRIGKILGGIAVLLAIMSFISEYVVEVVLSASSGSGNILVFVLDLFSVNLEQSIPTWFSVLILFGAAALLIVIAIGKHREHDPFAIYWSGLGILFIYLSMDEGAVIHEIIADPLQIAFRTTGFFTFGWQIVAIPLVVIVGLLYLRFLVHLPATTRNLFITAGGLYVGGALFVEGISANQWSIDNGISMAYLAIGTVEELCEMLGVVVFIYALLKYMTDFGYALAFLPRSDGAPTVDYPTRVTALKEESSIKSALRFANPQTLVILLLMSTNIALLLWVLNQNPQSLVSIELPFYQPIINELTENEVVIVQMPGNFNLDSPVSQQIAASLLAQYDEILIVFVPASNETYVFSGNNMPINSERLIELLHADGQVGFIIFDTATVSILVGSDE